MVENNTTDPLDSILTSIETKLAALESQKADVDQAILLKRQTIKGVSEALDHLLELEASLQAD
jgi:hypothetical protein